MGWTGVATADAEPCGLPAPDLREGVASALCASAGSVGGRGLGSVVRVGPGSILGVVAGAVPVVGGVAGLSERVGGVLATTAGLPTCDVGSECPVSRGLSVQSSTPDTEPSANRSKPTAPNASRLLRRA